MSRDQLDVALDRPLPQSPDAERAVLGSILLNNGAWYRLADLSTEDFFKEAHRAIFASMAMLFEERQPSVDILSVKDELTRQGRLEQIGGYSYLSSLTDGIPDIANVERYAKIIQRAARLRRLIVLGNKVMRAALEPDSEPDEIAASTMAELGPNATKSDNQSRRFATVLQEACEAQERRLHGQQDDIALRTGFGDLDGFRAIKRSFVVVGAPSEHGKTSFLINLADGLTTNGHVTAMFTLESTEQEVALRYASMKTGIPHGIMQDWRLMTDGHFNVLAKAKQAAGQAPLWITRKVRSIEAIAIECQRLRATEGLDAILVDYIQMVGTRERYTNPEQRLSAVSQAFLELSINLGIGVISTSQLREEWQERKSGRLIKEDLKGARAIAETARVVFMFHRPRSLDKTNEEYPWCEIKGQLEKNSENRTADIAMHFDETTQRFAEGDCEANDCRRLRTNGATRGLFK